MPLTTRRLLFAAGLLGLGSMVAAAQPPAAQEKPAETRTLKARIKYTGAGTVDEKHRIFLFVFDSPNFTQGESMPIGADANAASYTVNSATQIAATSPPGSAAVVDITVTAAGGVSATGASDRFTYAAAVPAMTERGRITLFVPIGLSAAYHLKRRRPEA
jgi:hypothetical protein